MNMQTFQVPSFKGLDLVSPPQVLSQNPGSAVVLNNFEVLSEGGYRRINGAERYGDLPEQYKNSEIRGVAYYEGIVVVVGTDILHSPSPYTWFVVNRDGLDKTSSAELDSYAKHPSRGSGPVQFSLITVGADEKLIITDDVGRPAMLTVDGYNYSFEVSKERELTGYICCARYQDHIVYSGSEEHKGTIVVSNRFDPLTASPDVKDDGTIVPLGAWSAQVGDEVVGLHTFRDYLYVFCRKSIYRIINLESAQNAQMRPVTTKVGCVDGRTIQEIGGDILFLSDDGLRYLGATERIDDVALNVVSEKIKPLLDNVDPSRGPISSVVIPKKSQYRLFYTDNLGLTRGIIGTLGTDGVFGWATTSDLWVESITTSLQSDKGLIYHVGSSATGVNRVYLHDHGSDLDGTALIGEYRTPNFDMGDGSIRKTLHFLSLFLEAENLADVELQLIYDRHSPLSISPPPYYLSPVSEASRWGDVLWGVFTWGSIPYPLDDLFLEGSGKWVQLIFRDNSRDNSPYIIRGFNLQYTPAGRV